jgi:predicted short-subunit dehydrogenase-like oxidoreductase (DUF2520 family)
LPKSISIIGGGRLATNLGRLWARAGVLRIQDVACRSLDSSRKAIGLIGSGRPVTEFKDMRDADIFLIATPDQAIASVTAELVASGRIAASSVVFHCSGAESSSLLESARAVGAPTASAHPLMTFSEQPMAAEQFAGTYCAVEGDPPACVFVDRIFAAIGAKTIALLPDQKILYHAAAIFASNYLATLLQAAIDTHKLVGIPPGVSREMLAPLARRSVENAITAGPDHALTGPIRRGDVGIVQRQFAALSAVDPTIADLYRILAAHTAMLANVPDPLTPRES